MSGEINQDEIGVTTNKPRVPAHIRELIAGALKRIAEGPAAPMTCPMNGEDYNAGLAEGLVRHAGWRHSWIEHDMRQILAWADGTCTATEIRCYGAGSDYNK